MPSLRIRHSRLSADPVVSAIFGMSPSDLFFGSRVSPIATALSMHCATLLTVIWRRHLPVVITSGILGPAGTFSSRNAPVASLTVDATGLPGNVVEQRSQLTPSVNGGS